MKKTVFIIYTSFSTFVKKDVDSISKEHITLTYEFRSSKSLFSLLKEFLRLFLFLIKNIRKIDVILSWFCDYHTFIPVCFAKIFKKRSLIIVGGFDAVSIPHLKFGIFFKKNLRSFLAKKSYKLARYILPVDSSLVEDLNVYSDPKGKGYPIGIKNFVGGLKAQICVLPTGYDSEIWSNKNKSVRDRKSIISVANINNKQTYQRKGYDLLVDVAKLLPEFKFTLVGFNTAMKEFVLEQASSNVNVIGYVENSKLPELLSQNYIYAQFSESEGLPNSLCEAMLCECVPLGSAVNGIPDGIGHTGFILKEKIVDKAVKLILEASEETIDLGALARKRIIEKYSHARRENKLLKIISSN